MRITVDLDEGIVIATDKSGERRLPIGSDEGFHLVSKAWLRSGWDAKHVYSFTWLGRPIIQLPEDMLRLQEVIYRIKPAVIIETGVAHGGSLVFYAGLFRAMGRGRVIGVDIEIRPHNRAAIESHELSSLITLIEGDSSAPDTVARVRNAAGSESPVMVVLDSNHTKTHVLKELRAYSELVTPGSYIVATDGIMEDLVGAPRSNRDWAENNPKAAVLEFVRSEGRFAVEEPGFAFNEGSVRSRVTYWPSAYLRRLK